MIFLSLGEGFFQARLHIFCALWLTLAVDTGVCTLNPKTHLLTLHGAFSQGDSGLTPGDHSGSMRVQHVDKFAQQMPAGS